MSVIGSNILAGASGQGGYFLTNSLRFRSSASASLSRTPASGSNRTTWTWSGWVKRAEISDTERVFFSAGVDGNNFTALEWINSSLFLQNYTSGTQTITSTTAVFRDPSAWYHIVLAIDTTQGTAADRAKIYVNGVQQAGFSGTPFSSSQQFWINHTYTHRIGSRQLSSADAFSEQYMTEINFVDGQQLTPSSFGETSTTTGVWIPKKFSGTYGTNGFYVKFTDTTSTSTLGTDFSGNSNTWTVNNISLTAGSTYDSMTDVPTLTSATAGNYATWNPLDKNSGITTSNGNLDTAATVAYNRLCRTTFGMSSGKWYCEIVLTSGTVGGIVGLVTAAASLSVSPGDGAGGWGYVHDGRKVISGSYTLYGASYGLNDVVGLAFDADNGTFTAYKNGATQGTLASGLASDTYFFGTDSYTAQTINFGQRPFAYTPPSGFKALNTFNLPTPTIGATASTTANKYMDVLLHTGNGGSQSITGLNFSPDFWWVKSRNLLGSHCLFDQIRGANSSLFSELTLGENNNWTGQSFNSNGVTADAAYSYQTNGTGYTFVDWFWKANGAGSSNTAGSITSTVSANTSAGFSIVTFTAPSSGQFTVGHGLGVTPNMVIVKDRTTGSTTWVVYHSSLGVNNTDYLVLNTTAAEASFSTMWGASGMTSSTCGFTVGGSTYANDNHVAYCFAQVAGYSAFGSYTGNSSSDGPFVFTGFRPRYVMTKRSDATESWRIGDSARSPYNAVELELFANLSNAEENNSNPIDYLSNGFKIRTSSSSHNASGGTYIYMVFAENPFKYANAR
jgi:hypothetical protein